MILDFALDYPKMVEALVPVSAAPSGFELQGPPPKYIPELMAAMQQGKIAEAAELQVLRTRYAEQLKRYQANRGAAARGGRSI